MACTLYEKHKAAYIQSHKTVFRDLPHHFFIPYSRLNDEMDVEITEFVRGEEATGRYNIFLSDNQYGEQCWLLCFDDEDTAFRAKIRFG